MVVIAELLMDLRILGMEESSASNFPLTKKMDLDKWNRNRESDYLVPDVLHSISIAILSMFVLESLVKLFAFGAAFLKLGWEVFDTLVVIVTFVLDVVMQHSHSSTNGLGLFIILRLWRVARILNSNYYLITLSKIDILANSIHYGYQFFPSLDQYKNTVQ